MCVYVSKTLKTWFNELLDKFVTYKNWLISKWQKIFICRRDVSSTNAYMQLVQCATNLKSTPNLVNYYKRMKLLNNNLNSNQSETMNLVADLF